MILTIMGTRPQYVKCAVLREAYKKAGLDEILLDTGQHYDPNMSANIFKQLNVAEPDIKLKLGGQSQCKTIGSMVIELEDIVTQLNPDAVVVLGDTNSTLAGGLVAKKLGKLLVHVEAGLRSYDKSMPEEQNRVLVDHLSDLLLCPTELAVDNLNTESISKGVYFTGDVMYDAVLKYRDRFLFPADLHEFNIKEGFDLITLHRADALSSKDSLKKRIDYIREQSSTGTKIFLLHPHTEKKLKMFDINVRDFICIPPQGYLETQWLLSKANHLYTDSGGMQKEAFCHKCPTTTLRSTTEWTETLGKGMNKLWTEESFSNIGFSTSEPFGTGNASELISSYIKNYLD